MTRYYVTMGSSAIKTFIQGILPFVSKYLCESGCSTLLQMKTKQRNRLDVEMTCLVRFLILFHGSMNCQKKTITSIPLTVKFASWVQDIYFVSCIILFIIKYYSEKLFTNNLVLIKLEAKELINCQFYFLFLVYWCKSVLYKLNF